MASSNGTLEQFKGACETWKSAQSSSLTALKSFQATLASLDSDRQREWPPVIHEIAQQVPSVRLEQFLAGKLDRDAGALTKLSRFCKALHKAQDCLEDSAKLMQSLASEAEQAALNEDNKAHPSGQPIDAPESDRQCCADQALLLLQLSDGFAEQTKAQSEALADLSLETPQNVVAGYCLVWEHQPYVDESLHQLLLQQLP